MRAHNVTGSPQTGGWGKKTFLFESLGARLYLEKERKGTRNVSLTASQLVINLTSNNNVHTYDEMRYSSRINY